MVRIGVDDQASPEVEGFAGRAKSSLSAFSVAAGQLLANAITAVGTKTVELGQQAFQAYSDYEQLTGSVAKLYGSGQTLIAYAQEQGKAVSEVRDEYNALNPAVALMSENASKAWQTAGMSANQYMEQATGFSAALINSLGGDTQKAAEMTDVAMRAMSDNVNTFGSNADDVQNAIMGISRQNYTMLDNLKLGYAGTKQGMEQLIADANAWGAANGKASDLSIDSFADCVQAIEQVQEAQGIAGTTAYEAATTIEGSLSMVRASWENLLTAMGTGEGLDVALGNFTTSLETFGSNAIPVVSRIVESVSQALPPMLDQLGPVIQTWIDQLAPVIGPLALDVLNSVMQVLATNAPAILTVFGSALNTAIDVLIFDPIIDAASGLADAVGGAIAGLPDAFMSLLSSVIDGVASWASQLVADAGQAGSGFLSGIQSFFGQVPGAIAGFIASAVSVLVGLAGQAASAAANAGQSFLSAIQGGFNAAVSFVSSIPSRIVSALGDLGGLLVGAGRSVIDGFLSGLKGAWDGVTGFVGGIAGWIAEHKGPIEYDRRLLVPHGRAIMAGLGEGLERAFGSDVVPLVSGIGGRLADAMATGAPGLAWATSRAGSPYPAPTRTTVVNQSFSTRVVRSDQDMYAAATILSRSAMRTAMEVS